MLVLTVVACSARDGAATVEAARAGATAAAQRAPTAQELALAPRAGGHPLDQRIRMLQRRVPDSKVPAAELELLGWTFIARARELADPGSYQRALQCALAMEALEPQSHGALLLRGHALHSLHRFSDAEVIAHRLVAERGLAFDFGLLGDVLADRGELDQAITAYQRMVDIRPDAHSYARAGHARYMKGDLPGALEVMTMAARAASPRNRETFAWTWARLAALQLQEGAVSDAQSSVQRALQRFPEAQPALKQQAAIWLHQGQLERALAPLRAGAAQLPHPDVLWMLLDTLDALGRKPEADDVRAQLLATGASEDGRTFALYLATRGEQLARAEQLVQAELAERKDVYSYEALAWVQSAKGEHAAALENARRSLAAGTDDPRLYYHAGLIAERAGAAADAKRWLARANAAPAPLLPSQRAVLAQRTALLAPASSSGRARALPAPPAEPSGAHPSAGSLRPRAAPTVTGRHPAVRAGRRSSPTNHEGRR